MAVISGAKELTIEHNKQRKSIWSLDDVVYYHPEYYEAAPTWVKCRDAVKGQDAIKGSRKEFYLPKLSGHEDADGQEDYNSLVQYASWYNATGRTVLAYLGLLFRKDPIVRIPSKMDFLFTDFTIKSEGMFTFMAHVAREIIITNRAGVLIDYPNANESISVDSAGKQISTPLNSLSREDASKLNLRPYASLYRTEAIINWEERRINNRIQTSLVVLKEEDYVRASGQMAPQKVVTYRILELDEDGFYRQIVVQQQELFTDGVRSTHHVITDVIHPLMNGQKMDFIPFYPITSRGITWDIIPPVIDDLADVNIAHYRNTAFYERAIAWTASPTAVFSGLPDEDSSVAIGSTKGITIAIGGTAKYLEYTGQGINGIRDALKSKEEQMAALGAKVLSPQTRGVESAEAALIHRAGEQGMLADIANVIGNSFKAFINIMCEWHNVPVKDINDIQVDINKDYLPIIMDANLVVALGLQLEKGRISYPSYFYTLQKGEVLPPGVTADDEMANIEKYAHLLKKESDDNVTHESRRIKVQEEEGDASEEETG